MHLVEGLPREPFRCLRCDYEFDRASGIGTTPAEQPTAGSISLCIRCGDVAIFTAAVPPLRAPSAQERAAIEADPELVRIRGILRRAIAVSGHTVRCPCGRKDSIVIGPPLSDRGWALLSGAKCVCGRVLTIVVGSSAAFVQPPGAPS